MSQRPSVRTRRWAWTLWIPLLAGPGCDDLDAAGTPSIRNSTILGVPRLGAVGTRGHAEGDLFQPRGVEALPDGSCVVVDRSGRVQRFSDRGEVVDCWTLPDWRAGQPVDLAYTPWDTVLIGDTHYSRILEFDGAGREIRRITLGGPDLELVRGIAVGRDDVIYAVAYGSEDRVHRFSREGRHLGTFGRSGEGPGEFARPEGVTVSDSGDVFVVDSGHHSVHRFTCEGGYRSTFGSEGSEPGRFRFPFDIASGGSDTLYVVDYSGNRVQRFTVSGDFLGAAGGAGREVGRLAAPRGVAVRRDPKGDVVFVADTYNHRVQRFQWKYDR